MDLVVILWPFRKSSKWYRTLVSRLICFFTNGNYTHAGIFIDYWMYESSVMNDQNGARKSWWKPPSWKKYVCLKLKVPLPQKEKDLLKYWLDRKVEEERPYNFAKIAVLMLVYPTRWFWNWIGWVPFQNEVYGSVCSVFVDEAFKQIGIDLLPGQDEEYTSPSDFLKSDLLEPV